MESFNKRVFELLALPTEFPQDNISESKANVIRGMHLQKNNPQGKLVTAIRGHIQDVCIDLRPGETFGQTYSVKLGPTKEGFRQFFYIPPGFAHGFRSLTDCIVQYKCTTLYDKESDGGINPMESGIDWGLKEEQGVTISEKDRMLPSLLDYYKACH